MERSMETSRKSPIPKRASFRGRCEGYWIRNYWQKSGDCQRVDGLRLRTFSDSGREPLQRNSRVQERLMNRVLYATT